jgi:hypothetical protein
MRPDDQCSARAICLGFVALFTLGHAVLATAAMRLDVHRGFRTADVALETLRLAFALTTLSHR